MRVFPLDNAQKFVIRGGVLHAEVLWVCLLMHSWTACAEIFHSCISLYEAGCVSVLQLLFCVADHVSYVSFGLGATSFQLVVKILIYLFHLTSFFLLETGS